MKNRLYIFLLSLLITACSDSSEIPNESGFHFQGRDCVACHNIDLQDERYLSFGGTLYKEKNITSDNRLEMSCNSELIVHFLSADKNISSNDYYDANSKGHLGRGNIFMLGRLNEPLNGKYTIKIETSDGTPLAQSGVHQFNAKEYNINQSVDYNNRVSCNTCHKIGGETSILYVQQNSNFCN